jgi:hypothetical protein
LFESNSNSQLKWTARRIIPLGTFGTLLSNTVKRLLNALIDQVREGFNKAGPVIGYFHSLSVRLLRIPVAKNTLNLRLEFE